MHIHLLIPTARLGQGLLALAEAAGIENCVGAQWELRQALAFAD